MKKVLIVDDDPDILEAVQMILDSEGYDTNVTLDGHEAFTKAKHYNPDLIVLDYLLSGIDGGEICKKLKSNKETQNIPVVMISAHPPAKEIAIQSGAVGFIPKPFSLDFLLEEINKHVQN